MDSNGAPARESNSDDEPSPQPLSDPPPTHHLLSQRYDSFEALYSDLKEFATAAGFGVYKIRSSNHVNGKPTRVDIACKRGKVRKSATLSRQTSTTKMDCPWAATARSRLDKGIRTWSLELRNSYSDHSPN